MISSMLTHNSSSQQANVSPQQANGSPKRLALVAAIAICLASIALASYTGGVSFFIGFPISIILASFPTASKTDQIGQRNLVNKTPAPDIIEKQVISRTPDTTLEQVIDRFKSLSKTSGEKTEEGHAAETTKCHAKDILFMSEVLLFESTILGFGINHAYETNGEIHIEDYISGYEQILRDNKLVQAIAFVTTLLKSGHTTDAPKEDLEALTSALSIDGVFPEFDRKTQAYFDSLLETLGRLKQSPARDVTIKAFIEYTANIHKITLCNGG